MQVFPSNVRNFWDEWELRVMVLSSLIFYGILVIFGNKRKNCTRTILRITLWFAYLLADWIATISLGVISNKVRENEGDFVEPKHVIISLWAPILLIHLGGSDTITAYSMEDNELWSRRFLSFCVQLVLALYIFLRAWTNDSDFNILVIPMFIAGIIKIGERIWVLRSASSQQFKESLFPDPDPGPNYARYMEAYIAASREGFRVDVKDLETSSVCGDDHTHTPADANIISLPHTDTYGPEIVEIAEKFFKTFKPLFADLILSFSDVLESRLYLQNGNGKKVFKVMEVELGFIYDMFYTKAAVAYSYKGSFLRLVALSCNVSVLCGFFVVQKNQYPKVDVFITYLLLLGTITLEICSVISLYILSPDRTMLWLSRHRNKVTSHMMRALKKVKNKRWSGSIGQFNLISFCLKDKKQRCGIDDIIVHDILCLSYRKAFKVAKRCLVRMIMSVYHSYYQKNRCSDTEIVNDLKEIIFEHYIHKVKEVNVSMREEAKDEEKVADEIKRFCYHRGDKVLEKFECSPQLGWSVEGEFDQSILLWHIATDLCYNGVFDEEVDNGTGPNFREASKLLSEYMLYLLVVKPSMLPNGIGEIRFQDTCAEAIEFVMDRKSIKRKEEACQKLLQVSSESENVLPLQVKGDRSKSILFEACRLAIRIGNLKKEEAWETKTMWELITQVWVEMLGFAASHCQGTHHVQQLKHGGELLTHVFLLMAHLGITDQFQISKGHARKKLIRK